jgi:hypothetical protein
LKAPGTKRLKLYSDETLSSFSFKFNLRRYTTERARRIAPALAQVAPAKLAHSMRDADAGHLAGALFALVHEPAGGHMHQTGTTTTSTTVVTESTEFYEDEATGACTVNRTTGGGSGSGARSASASASATPAARSAAAQLLRELPLDRQKVGPDRNKWIRMSFDTVANLIS